MTEVATEIHHISYVPEITIQLSLEKHHEIHRTIPNKSELATLMRQYDKIVKLSVMVQNWQTAFSKEFGKEKIFVDLSFVNKEKQRVLKEASKYFTKELSIIKIKGVGIRFLAGILAYAHPQRFSSKKKFLHYCGYTNSSHITNKYSRKVHSLGYLIARRVIMAKDGKYYPLYQKIKTKLSLKNPTYSKGKIDGMARNRVGTAIFSEIYHKLKERSAED